MGALSLISHIASTYATACAACSTFIFGTFGTTEDEIEFGSSNPTPILSAICLRKLYVLVEHGVIVANRAVRVTEPKPLDVRSNIVLA